jgi:hypothetical protein
MCIDILNIFACYKNKKYNKLSESSKIVNDTIQETTYIPVISDTIHDEYEKLFRIHSDDEEFIFQYKDYSIKQFIK